MYFDSRKLTDNVRRIKALCRQQGVTLAAVVKAGCGWTDVARAALDGDCDMLADSRLHNLEQLAHGGIDAATMLLRLPAPSQAEAVVRLCEISLNSEYDSIHALHAAAHRLGRKHRVLLMVELGDRREGVAAQQLPQLIERIKALPMIEVAGIGTNLGCLGGIRTTPEKLTELVELARASERQLGYPLQYVSGGNSGTLPLLLEGRLPAGINHIRVGFSMLLGRNPFTDEPLPGLHTDVFELEAELIEVQTKSSLPDGEIVLDAFGHVPVFEDLGDQVRGILSLGRLDTDLATLKAKDSGIEIIGASSDHLVLDMTSVRGAYAVGDKVRLVPGYGALVQAMLSPYVTKRPDLNAGWRRERGGLLRMVR
ncbi:hypothetical protein GCM10011352_12310 [Marinobacterium zhoushanense]|uniref:Alanine racemase N-terminal domain-containing protein n=1 Tax=Marinobacterium zhoushanense TaxID=1679163 RepID=A0ABQ1K8F8_9GAMM|nr:hypothetical protein GCM10011352_12310 [Marinobacterium zhoushanense]